MNMFNCFKRSKGGRFFDDLQSIDLLEISSRELNRDKFFVYNRDKMENVRKIGSTHYSEVYRVEIEDETLAYKKILTNIKGRKQMSKIFKKLRKLRFDGILPILGGVIDEPNFGYAMPHQRRDMKTFLTSYRKKNGNPYPYLKKLEIIISLAKNFSRLSLENVVHGSIKLENIFVDDKRGKVLPVVSDAMISNFFREICSDIINPVGGSSVYTAPEMRYFRKTPDIASDIYSFGWIIYFIISEDFSYSKGKTKVIGREERVPYIISDLLERIMHPQPSKRMTFLELVKELKRIKGLEEKGHSPLRIFLQFRSHHPLHSHVDGKIIKVVIEKRNISTIMKKSREFMKASSETKPIKKRDEEEDEEEEEIEEEEEEGESDDSDDESEKITETDDLITACDFKIFLATNNGEGYERLEDDSQLAELNDDSILEVFPKLTGLKIGSDRIVQTCKEEFEICKSTQTGHSINEVTEYAIELKDMLEKEKMERKIESQLLREKHRTLQIQHENVTSKNTERILNLEEEKTQLEEALERTKDENEIRISKAVSESQRELEKLKMENEKLQEILEMVKIESKGYKDERNTLLDDVETKIQKIKELEDQNFTMLGEKEEISRQMISKLQELQVMVRDGADQSKEDGMRWEDQKVKYEKENQKLKIEVKKQVTENKKLRDEVWDKESDLTKIIKNNRHYQEQIRKLKNRIEEMKYEKKELALEIDHMNKENSITDIKVERMKDEQQILKIKLESKYIHERKSMVSKYTSTKSTLSMKDIEAMEVSIKEYQKKIEEQKQRIEELNMKHDNESIEKEEEEKEMVQKLKLENEKLASKLESTNKTKDRMKRNWDDVRKALFQVKKKESKKKERMKAFVSENKKMKLEIESLKKKLLNFQKETNIQNKNE